ncbi:hypothetical protein DPMN_025781 [Dreissena polymorpha]|uniref:Uncharacterized protein n=1 Tax=Dreissena polymorpha TaxID=45954 RepID=A0A9D4LRP4_DREPO|nr:hypothetical protein DPMN_025781 [Dreissena polymorpha]
MPLSFELQLSIRGTDGGSPTRSDNSNLVVRVNIQRNNAPRIDGVSEITLNDNASPGSVVYTFNATDSDAVRLFVGRYKVFKNSCVQ